METALLFVISSLASIVGSISGIGGGIIIKPALEAVTAQGIDVINFLSGCAVLSMAVVSLVIRRRGQASNFDYKRGAMLAVGSIFGGIAGKMAFDALLSYFSNNAVSVIQAATLSLIMLLLLLYLILRNRVAARQVEGSAFCILLGCGLGMVSAFLGIGGGPLNLAVLAYFLSMDHLQASFCSIYIVFFAQIAHLVFTLWTGTVPAYPPPLLACVIGGGISGALVGCKIVSHMNSRQVGKLYGAVLVAVFFLSAANARNYFVAMGLD
jgi:uncharacterized membrane protein YfcA